MGPLRILIADDEALIRLGLRTMLSALGHTCTLAANGREALQAARAAPFDLAVLDIEMPLTNGLEAARVLARKHPMPIIILTAYSQPELIAQAAQLPIHGYLVKPVSERELAAAIEIAVARFADAQAAARENAELRATLAERKLVERAKGVLMRGGLSEEDAYLEIQRRARAARVSVGVIAEQILQKPESP